MDDRNLHGSPLISHDALPPRARKSYMVNTSGHRLSFAERVAYSPELARLAFYALRSRVFTSFPPYRFLLARTMRILKMRNAVFPREVTAESTNLCNSRCMMCAHPNMKRHKGFMAMPLYRKIVDECALYPGIELRLSGIGEPLLDPDLFSRIRYAKDRGIGKVHIITNASLLDEKRARELIDSGIDEIVLSVEGYDSPSYRRIRVGLDFDAVRENAMGLRRMRGLGKTPRIIASIILFPEYASHRREMIETWRDCADVVFVKPPENWAGEVPKSGGDVSGGNPNIPCPYLWTQFIIAWDGTVGLCCKDFCNMRIAVGDVTRESIYQIWHGETMKRFREILSEGRTLEPCRHCGYVSNWWGEI